MISIYVATILCAILIQAFFTASEMAFTCISPIKLKSMEDSGDFRVERIKKFMGKKGMYLGTTLVGTNIAVVVASALATRISVEYLGPSISPVVATAVMVPITLIFAEIVPKMIARQFATTLAVRSATPLNIFFKIFYPLIIAVNSIAKLFLLPFGKGASDWDSTFTKKDLKEILLLGKETGGMEEDEVELIHKVLDFGAKSVGSIMVPLYRVSSISDDDITDNLKKLVSLTGFSRIPVYKEHKHTIIGIVNIYDVLFEMEENEKKHIVSDFLREPVYVNKTDGLDIALARLRHQKQPMGIVVDEDESVVGIITIEDMLEEIVGEIEDIV